MSVERSAGIGAVVGGTTGAAGLGLATASLTGPAANLGAWAGMQTLAAGSGLAGPALTGAAIAVGGPVVLVAGTAAVAGAVIGGLLGLFD